MEIPEFLTEDINHFYCPKENVEDIKSLEDFIPLSDLLEDSSVTNAFYNVIGTLYGKHVVVL